jgi:hypothetical protein
MKSIIKTALVLAALNLSVAAMAQEKDTASFGKKVGKTAKKAGNATASAAKTVGNATASTASKGASKVVDKTYKGKTGPNGETVYINNKSQYYYVNKKGGRVYVTEAQLKDKPE